jgi:hypothetical protein
MSTAISRPGTVQASLASFFSATACPSTCCSICEYHTGGISKKDGAAARRGGTRQRKTHRTALSGFRDLSSKNLSDTDRAEFPAPSNQKTSDVFRRAEYSASTTILGKETVQNLVYLRFREFDLRALWNSNHISSVEIDVLESAASGTRGGYYDRGGAPPRHAADITLSAALSDGHGAAATLDPVGDPRREGEGS